MSSLQYWSAPLSSSGGSPSSLRIGPTQLTARSSVQCLHQPSAATVCSSSQPQQTMALPKCNVHYVMPQTVCFACTHQNTYTYVRTHVRICTKALANWGIYVRITGLTITAGHRTFSKTLHKFPASCLFGRTTCPLMHTALPHTYIVLSAVIINT